MLETLKNFLSKTGIYQMFSATAGDGTAWWKYAVMYIIIGILFYLAIVKKYEPLLLLSISFGMLLGNLPGAQLLHMEFFIQEEVNFGQVLHDGGLLDILYLGVKLGIYPSLIFLGVGAMTDFTPLIANPKSLLMGAAAQFGVFFAFFGALMLGGFDAFGFNELEAAAIGIIGGADGPTAILVTKILAPGLLGAIAIAAYSYMALIPIIQPPFMKLLTTEKERKIKMTNLRPVSQTEKVVFPILVSLVVILIVPDAAPLIGFLMLGNLFTVSGVTERLSKTAQNELINIVTICLGVCVGATAHAANFLSAKTFGIIILGLTAFCFSTMGGLLFGKLMCFLTKGKINPLIGSAGVSAVPMAARVSQIEGQKADPSNFLLMHAMGPNVAGVIGSAVAAGVFLAMFR
jgi:oxaloacetate decarboxylase beta subunit